MDEWGHLVCFSLNLAFWKFTKKAEVVVHEFHSDAANQSVMVKKCLLCLGPITQMESRSSSGWSLVYSWNSIKELNTHSFVLLSLSFMGCVRSKVLTNH